MQKKDTKDEVILEVPHQWKEDFIRVLKYGLEYVQPKPPEGFVHLLKDFIQHEEEGLNF
jgi:hypothetical protein